MNVTGQTNIKLDFLVFISFIRNPISRLSGKDKVI
jgi:hypothetical protein